MSLVPGKPINFHLDPITITSNTVTLNGHNQFVMGNTTADATWTLPILTSVYHGAMYIIKNIGTFKITIVANPANNIDGATNIEILAGQSLCLMSSGSTSWKSNIFTGGASTSIKFGHTAYVDSVYGDDATGELDDPAYPFLTCLAAKTAAPAGTTIYVAPGNYTEQDLAKDQISWNFANGTVITASGNLFDDGGSNMFVIVSGEARFTNSGGAGILVNLTGSSIFVANCLAFVSVGGTNVFDINNNGCTVFVNAYAFQCDSGRIFNLQNGILNVTGHVMQQFTPGGQILNVGSNVVASLAANIVGGNNSDMFVVNTNNSIAVSINTLTGSISNLFTLGSGVIHAFINHCDINNSGTLLIQTGGIFIGNLNHGVLTVNSGNAIQVGGGDVELNIIDLDFRTSDYIMRVTDAAKITFFGNSLSNINGKGFKFENTIPGSSVITVELTQITVLDELVVNDSPGRVYFDIDDIDINLSSGVTSPITFANGESFINFQRIESDIPTYVISQSSGTLDLNGGFIQALAAGCRGIQLLGGTMIIDVGRILASSFALQASAGTMNCDFNILQINDNSDSILQSSGTAAVTINGNTITGGTGTIGIETQGSSTVGGFASSIRAGRGIVYQSTGESVLEVNNIETLDSAGTTAGITVDNGLLQFKGNLIRAPNLDSRGIIISDGSFIGTIFTIRSASNILSSTTTGSNEVSLLTNHSYTSQDDPAILINAANPGDGDYEFSGTYENTGTATVLDIIGNNPSIVRLNPVVLINPTATSGINSALAFTVNNYSTATMSVDVTANITMLFAALKFVNAGVV